VPHLNSLIRSRAQNDRTGLHSVGRKLAREALVVWNTYSMVCCRLVPSRSDPRDHTGGGVELHGGSAYAEASSRCGSSTSLMPRSVTAVRVSATPLKPPLADGSASKAFLSTRS
jgi:hypothetical protein